MFFVEGKSNREIDKTIAFLNNEILDTQDHRLGVVYIGEKYVRLDLIPRKKVEVVPSEDLLGSRKIANNLIEMMVNAKTDFMFSFGYRRDVTIINQDDKPDNRFSWMSSKPSYKFPKYDFLDGYVFVNSYLRVGDIATGERVNIRAVVFHELMECFARIEYDMTGLYAHEFACEAEVNILKYRRKFTKGLAGYGEKAKLNVKYTRLGRTTVPIVKRWF